MSTVPAAQDVPVTVGLHRGTGMASITSQARWVHAAIAEACSPRLPEAFKHFAAKRAYQQRRWDGRAHFSQWDGDEVTWLGQGLVRHALEAARVRSADASLQAGCELKVSVSYSTDPRLLNRPASSAEDAALAWTAPLGLTGAVAIAGIGMRVPPRLAPSGDKLWAHQRRALSAIFNYTTDSGLPGRRGVIHAVTGSGKSAMIALTAHSFNGRALVLVSQSNLVRQMHKDILRFSSPSERSAKYCGRWGGGYQETDAQIVVATPHSIMSAMRKDEAATVEWLSEFSTLILDEAHRLKGYSSKSPPWAPDISNPYPEGIVSAVVRRCDALQRFAFSGTPKTESVAQNWELRSQFGEVVFEVLYEELVANGTLAWPWIGYVGISTAPFAQLSDEPTYQEVYHECISVNTERDEVAMAAVRELHRNGLKTLVMCQSLVHADRMRHLIESETGSPVSCVTGQMTSKQQAAAFAEFGEDDGPQFLVASRVADEGVDVPAIQCVLLLGGGKSHVKTLQRFGRGMRGKSGDNRVLILDFLDVTHTWLKNHAEKRLKEYGKMGADGGAFKVMGGAFAADLTQLKEEVVALVGQYVAAGPDAG